MPTDFHGAFAALRQILKKHGKGTIVHVDTPTNFTLLSPAIGPNGKPLWFGAVMSKKSAVTYHFMPLYFNPRLDRAIAPELRPRMQGKACFNFQRPDAALFAKLEELTRIGREQWDRSGFFAPGPISPERLDAALKEAGEDPVALARWRKKIAASAAAKRAATLKRKRTGARRRP